MPAQLSPKRPTPGLPEHHRQRLTQLEQAESLSEYNEGELDAFAFLADSDEDRSRVEKLLSKAKKDRAKRKHERLKKRIQKAIDQALQDQEDA